MALLLAFALLVTVACSEGSEDDGAASLAADVVAALTAVDAARGGPQEYFEVTALHSHVNVFVAIDEATAAIPYVYRDGELEPPAPTLEGASGFTFGAAAIDLDEERVLARVSSEVPDATIESFSVEGGPDGAVRYVAVARSSEGGALEIVVTRDGDIASVDPI